MKQPPDPAYIAEQLENAAKGIEAMVEHLATPTLEGALSQVTLLRTVFWALVKERSPEYAVERLGGTLTKLKAKVTEAGFANVARAGFEEMESLVELQAAGGPFRTAEEAADGIQEVLDGLAEDEPAKVLPFPPKTGPARD